MSAFGHGIHHVVIVGIVLLAGVSFGVPGTALAQQATPTAEDAPAWLMVQAFDAATLDPEPTTGTSKLTLSGIAARVLAFTDRPDRRVGFVDTPDFIQAVTTAQADPLNATLVAPLPDGTDALLVVELRAAEHDASAGTVVFQVTILGAAMQSSEGAQASPIATTGTRAFGPGHLFVDAVVQVPVRVPVNLCGNTVDVIGVLNPAFGNTCVND